MRVLPAVLSTLLLCTTSCFSFAQSANQSSLVTTSSTNTAGPDGFVVLDKSDVEVDEDGMMRFCENSGRTILKCDGWLIPQEWFAKKFGQKDGEILTFTYAGPGAYLVTYRFTQTKKVDSK